MATISGGSGNDTLIGNGDAIGDQFYGLGGNDSITGDNGEDTLEGGAGNDTLNGGGNYDTADYRSLGAVNVNLSTGVATGASTGTDSLIGIEDVYGSNANDTLTGSGLDNWLFGYLGDDYISGGDGNDVLYSGGGNDTLNGENGNDTLYGQAFQAGTNSYFYGGNGTDLAVIDASDLATAAFSGNLNGLSDGVNGINITFGDTEKLYFWGNATGGYVSGGTLADTLVGLDGNDSFYGGQGDNVIDGGGGTDWAHVDYSDRTGNLYLVNGGVSGTAYNASIGGAWAGSVANVEALGINGGLGNDTIGSVVYQGATIDFMGGSGTDVAIVDASGATGSSWYGGVNGYSRLYDVNGGSVGLYDIEALNFTGNATYAAVYGTNGNDTLTGLSGNDSFHGGLGNNVIDGGAGTDYAFVDYSDRTGNVYLVNGGVAGTTYSATVGGVAAGSVRNLEALGVAGGSGNDTIGGVVYYGASFDMNGGGGTDVAVIDASPAAGSSWYGGINNYGRIYDTASGANIGLGDFEALYFTGNATYGIVYGGVGSDSLTGLAGNDSFDGGTGNNTIDGGLGTDWAYVDFSDRTGNVYLVNGGVAGTTYAATVGGVAAGSVRNVEALGGRGGSGNDTIGGVVYSGAAFDSYGGGGTDVAVIDASGVTSGSWYGGIPYYGRLYDVTSGASIGLADFEALYFTGNATYGIVYGGVGSDSLTGMSGNDSFDGGTGNNTIDGGAGTDWAYVDYSDRTGNVWLVNGGVAGTTYYATVGGVAAGSVRNVEALGGRGGSGNDTIGGVVYSGAAFDSYGGDGTDVAVIDASALSGSAWYGGINYYSRIYDATTGASIGLSDFEALQFTGNATWNVVYGGSGNDTLTGLSGNDSFDGGMGNNVINGGSGRDWAFVDYSDRTGNLWLVNGGVASTTYTALIDGVASGSVRNIEAMGIYGGSGNDTIGGVIYAGVSIEMDGNDGYDIAVIDASAVPNASFYGGINYYFRLYDGVNGGSIGLYDFEALNFTGSGAYGWVYGGDGNDTLTGLGLNDSFNSGLGNDSINGAAGADSLYGEGGNDTLLGGDGSDIIDGGSENDSINGGSRWDTLTGGSGNDTIDGGLDNDQMYGGTGDDLYYVDNTGDRTNENADEGTDSVISSISLSLAANVEHLTLTGSAALTGTGNSLNNRIIGNDGANTLSGGNGNDTVDGGAGADSIDGGTGHDSLLGGARWDTLIGGDGNDTLDGGLDNDQMYGGIGNDIYYVDNTGDRVNESTLVNEGNDTVYASISWDMTAAIEAVVLTGTGNTSSLGNSLNNVMTGNTGNNTLSGSSGNDTINGGDGNDSIDGGVDSDLIDGGIGNDTILGGQRWDTLTGGDGDDVIDGGTENDRMVGGIGNDTYYIDHVGDRAVENAGEGTDTVYASIDWAMTPEIEHMFLIGTAIAAVGNGLNNRITGNASNNVINGGNGADTITGGAGADTLTGGTARDDFVFGSAATNGTDRIMDFTHAIDRLVFKGSDYGFAAGTVLTAAQFTAGSAAVGTGAQFIWDAATGHLYWDADGTGAGARVDLAVFDGVPGVTKDDLVFTV